MAQTEILGTSTVTDGHRISLIEAARNAGLDVEVGDRVVYKLEGGRVVLDTATE